MSTGRLESFSDGVLAVAITLLSLDLAVDGPGHGTLAHQLTQRWPSFASYVVSFLVIGIIWINHHSLFSNLERIDRVRCSSTSSSCSSWWRSRSPLPPWPSTCARGNDAHLAAALYAVVSLGMGLAFALMFLWSSRHGQFRIALDPGLGEAPLYASASATWPISWPSAWRS